MSSTATSSGKVKGGRGQNKRCWTTKEDNTLMECLMELHQNTNWRGDSGFKNGYLNKLETMLEVKLLNSGLKASPHIESRVKTLKGKYGALANALSQCGFGWNEEEMMLNKKDASGLYGKSFPHYYALGEIYGKERAIGTNAGNADDDEEDVRRADSSVHQNRSVGDYFIEEMFSHPNEKDLVDMQAKLGGELKKIEFQSPLQVFRITNVLAKEHDLLRIFFTMTDEEKKDYAFNLMEHGLQCL
ncbi:hypothetical protein PRUPE_2G067700 [Prunus persica]|uniref:Myb/SANT-like domain-containing protein n=1 Tax=Prunus persica TaxID=3760 RepID=A0A251QFM4_PRUPE|nr:hypothetical protein PRUPE_2G067700 [Prunus persica]